MTRVLSSEWAAGRSGGAAGAGPGLAARLREPGGERPGRGAGRGPGERVLPVAEPLARLLPAGGLRRGSTVAVPGGPGSGSLLLALLAEASAGGAWVGVVGRPELGVVAAAEAGLRLERLALVPRPGADLLAVTSALLDGLDVVAVAGAERAGIRAADRQRLAARARQRGAVLVALGRWPGADLELSCADARWHGLGTRGRSAGLRAAAFPAGRVRVHGRGVAPGGLDTRLLLPAPGGGVADGAGSRKRGGRWLGWPDERPVASFRRAA